jgi:pSer/pThr/pTyr-binding forkhead associated (FHA) protein
MKFRLEIIEPADAKGKFEFDKNEVTLGRTSPNDIIINDSKVSRQHAKIEFKDNIPQIRDLGSQNGIIVNGNKIKDAELKSGDKIKIGDTQFHFILYDPSLLKKTSFSETKGITVQRPFKFPQLIKNPIILAAVGILLIIFLSSLFFSREKSTDKSIVRDDSHIPITLPAKEIYGNCKQDRTHKDKIIFTFKGKEDSKAFLTYIIGGIDTKDEIVISLNGEVVGNSPVTLGWKEVKNIRLHWEQISSSSDNLLIFDNTLNPPGDEAWGVREVNISWEKLLDCNLAKAEENFELAQRKYKDKAISYPNLYQSIKVFQESLDNMEKCSAKPAFYHRVEEMRQKASLELEQEYQKHLFNAERAFRLKEYSTTMSEYKIIMSMIPDTNDSRYQKAEEGLTQEIP